MAQLKYVYSVEELNGPAMASLGALHLGDRYGNVIQLDITRNGEPVDLTAGIITGTAIRADGGTITLSGTISSGYTNRCIVGLPGQCYTVPGPLHVFIRWEGDNNVKVTYFAGIGDVVSTDTGVIASSVVPETVSSLIAAINAATATIPSSYSSLEGMIAPNYSTTKVYKAGEVVRYSDNLYIRNANATAADGGFNSSNWTSIRLGNLAVMGHGQNISDGATSLPDADNAAVNRIYIINGGQSASSYIQHLPYEQAYGTLITLGTAQNSTYGLVQMFFSALGSTGYSVYERIKYNGGTNIIWSDWHLLTPYVSSNTLVMS